MSWIKISTRWSSVAKPLPSSFVICFETSKSVNRALGSSSQHYVMNVREETHGKLTRQDMLELGHRTSTCTNTCTSTTH